MKFFYDKNYYQYVYQRWSVKKAILMFLIASFVISFLFVIKLFSTFDKYFDAVFLKDFFNNIPQVWEIKNSEGLRVFASTNTNTEIFDFENKYLTINLNKTALNKNDFKNKKFIIMRKNLAFKFNNEIQYFPINDLKVQNELVNSIKIEINNKDDKLLIYRDNNFVRNISFNEVSRYGSKFLNILKFVSFLVVGPIVFLYIIISLFILTKIYKFIFKIKKRNIDAKKLFISFAPISFIYMILFFISKIVLNISSMPVNIICFIYTIIISFIFLNDEKLFKNLTL